MTKEPDWWLDDDHPDAAEHRKFLAEGKKKGVAVRAVPAPRKREPLCWIGKDGALAVAKDGHFGGAELQIVMDWLGDEIRQVAKRVRGLEANQLSIGGTWKPGVSYPEKCLVSFRGGLWLSRVPNNDTRPSEGPAWRLAVKRGDGDVK